ncbi:extracellular solute-binding protein [Streptomyces sp. NEAU-W12]|uniref:extracellular solute-binding protein n=1 Tax=Streptomyces sp. NEAU-W12 TaxID=2994668 RepID=UPI00224AABB6|nr:extracellular solute-binding protein [Streptomyces sp. NEAU-W12]MCX2928217.1 extracellular solute-binding protein [Streptomyces sp. NEAU-W12]
MTQQGVARGGRARAFTGAAVALAAALTIAGCGAPGTDSSSDADSLTPKKPAKPIKLTVMDGGGNLAGGGKAAIDAFVKANPDLVSGVTYQTAAGPDVAGKVRAQRSGGKMDISLVLGGPDVLGAAEKQDLLLEQVEANAESLPDLSAIQDAPRAELQKTAHGLGVLINYDPNGPFIDYNPDKVDAGDVPATPEELLEWAKAHKGEFAYAQPSGSGSGRAFIQALPYMLGDSDPQDPVKGWDKTWDYLAELGEYVNSYPASSTILAQQFGAGQLEVIPTIIAHDVSNRKTKTWPADTGIALFDNQNWISDGHFAMVPKGVSAETLYVVLKLESYLVGREAQQERLTTGVLTTANKDVTTENSGSKVSVFVEEWGRPDFYPKALKTGEVRVALAPDKMQEAFDLWQRNVGSKVGS